MSEMPWTCPQRDHSEALPDTDQQERAKRLVNAAYEAERPLDDGWPEPSARSSFSESVERRLSFWDRLEARINDNPLFGVAFLIALLASGGLVVLAMRGLLQ